MTEAEAYADFCGEGPFDDYPAPEADEWADCPEPDEDDEQDMVRRMSALEVYGQGDLYESE